MLEFAVSPGAFVGHAGYLLLILSMLMTRMAWLRALAIGSGLLEGTYASLWMHDPVSTMWEMLFVLTNVSQLAILAYRNRMARFTADERAFYEIAVPSLEPSEVRRLLRSGRWLEAPAGTVLTREGEVVADLVFIVAGTVEITIEDHIVGRCGTGAFVGEISVSTGGPANATAVAVSPVRYLAFERGFLRNLLDKSDGIGRAVELAFRHGLRDKLESANKAMLAASRPVTP